MRTFAELAQANHVRSWIDGTLYRQYLPDDAPEDSVVLRFDRAVRQEQVLAFASLYRAAREWLGRDPQLGAWITVDSPSEVGTDFVTMPRRHGHSLHNILMSTKPLPHLDALQKRFCDLRNRAESACDRYVTAILARHILEPSHDTIYVAQTQVFFLTDLGLSRIELRCWRALVEREPEPDTERDVYPRALE